MTPTELARAMYTSLARQGAAKGHPLAKWDDLPAESRTRLIQDATRLQRAYADGSNAPSKGLCNAESTPEKENP